jgi:hypothetical protein
MVITWIKWNLIRDLLGMSWHQGGSSGSR